jgi:hypothetical protein
MPVEKDDDLILMALAKARRVEISQGLVTTDQDLMVAAVYAMGGICARLQVIAERLELLDRL